VGYATTMMKSNGPSHAVGYKSSKKHDRHSLERDQCVCAVEKRVSKLTKTKSPSPLTGPTSLEMLKNSFQGILTMKFVRKLLNFRSP